MNKLRKNKKADLHVFRWVFNIIILGIIVATVMIITNRALAKKIDTQGLEYQILAARIVNNPLCLAYQDRNTMKVYPGLVNLQNYDNQTITDCLLSTENQRPLGVKLELTGKQPVYGYPDNYKDFGPLAFSNRYILLEKKLYVITVDNSGKRTPALLTISVTGKLK